MQDYYIGCNILWRKENPIPSGWIRIGEMSEHIRPITSDQGLQDYYKDIIILQRVDNLTYVEHLAKQRNIVL